MDQVRLKRLAAAAAVAAIEDGMTVGLGTGSTAAIAIDLLAERQLNIRCVATSLASEGLARAVGLQVVSDLSDVETIHYTFDGADEVDPQLNLIKGLGGALLREKLVALASLRHVIIVDASKLVARLGTRTALPVEIVAFGWRQTLARLSALGVTPTLRTANGEAIRTDNGNLLADCRLASGQLDGALGERIKAVPGVVEHGLFWGIATEVLIAHHDGAIERKARA